MQARVYEYLKQGGEANFLLCKNDKDALKLLDAALYADRKVFALPDVRVNFGDDLKPYRNEIFELLKILREFNKETSSKKILISPIRTALLNFPKPELFQVKTVLFGQKINLNELKNELINWGYSVVDIVEMQGEVSFRGDIVDIFTPDYEEPIRVSFFDEDVESIRFFSCENQKSKKEELESFTISPALFSFDEKSHLQVEKSIKKIKSDSFDKDMISLGFWALGEFSQNYLHILKPVYAYEMQKEIEEVLTFNENADRKLLNNIKTVPESSTFKDLQIGKIRDFIEFHKEQKITILARNEALLKQAEIDEFNNVIFKESPLIVNLTSTKEIVISLNKPLTKKRKKHASIILDELKYGDYVVHENYGIGIFRGLQNVVVLGVKRDFVVIDYEGDDKLLLPVENLYVIDRYIADSGTLAVVDRLGRGSFLKLKEKTKAKLFEIAKEIVDIAAKRELVEGCKIDLSLALIEEFQKKAGFIYTNDQERSIAEILNDLGSGKVMDRLLSGDVGFGKTEVAMNALLAVAKNNYQSLFIVPTTLLSHQHYKNLTKRVGSFGIKIAKLDRFTSAKEKSRILKELKDGVLDICIGTHALLGLECKNLGFVIIDEEHKFGVKQKEKLKNLRENAHILSMSATPIPRSLNMALSSIKQYSQILTPPDEREDVKTYIKEYDEKLIREVILREKRRGGQVFYIHNRIASIEDKAKELKSMLPNIKTLILHSKVNEEYSEKEMLKFENKEYDLLLSTSIIESGIHLPNVNTIIVEAADHFGIADLHQLRGRVGRGSVGGYCYFIVENKESLSENSRKRLVALESNSFLGSGSLLAYHDLEIRGGGNLIGEAQSGHIKQIGYSLYLKMLEDSINELLNKTPIKKRDVDLKLSINAFINDRYISEDRIRFELYRRLSRCENVKEVYEIEEEMNDRFGKIDTTTEQFLSLIIIKILAYQNSIKLISSYGQNISI
ncbi:MAG: transcription-repair coupling factor, partial [Campylobacteraceae bacterium]|nr:transcription-repair coupling factor [Campylobacteraceae bacterium]